MFFSKVFVVCSSGYSEQGHKEGTESAGEGEEDGVDIENRVEME